jgi:hypothetical protein
MAVPFPNGAVYLSKMGLEKAADNYDHGTAWPSYTPLSASLKHVSIGGHQDLHADEGYDFDATNACGIWSPYTSTLGDAPYSMSELMGYDHDAGGTAIGLSVRSPHNKFGTVCGLADDIDVYHDGSSTYAGSGDKIFTDSCASTAYSGASGWYKHTDPVGGGIYITVSGGNAEVTSTYPC